MLGVQEQSGQYCHKQADDEQYLLTVSELKAWSCCQGPDTDIVERGCSQFPCSRDDTADGAALVDFRLHLVHARNPAVL